MLNNQRFLRGSIEFAAAKIYLQHCEIAMIKTANLQYFLLYFLASYENDGIRNKQYRLVYVILNYCIIISAKTS